jgi:hypothetical protein
MKRKEAISMATDEGNSAYKHGVLAGRKDVIDWINDALIRCGNDKGLFKAEWQKQLKEWGLDERM